MAQTIFDFKVKDSKGRDFDLSQLRGKITVIVNVASRCGLTPQYAGLEALYRRFKAQGLVILAFPCNQFGLQEPGTDEEIQQFCSLNYDVTFPVLAKIDVNGDTAHPLYQFLKSSAPGILGTEAIKWNFTKFLIDPDGKIIQRYAPTDEPAALEKDIQALLK